MFIIIMWPAFFARVSPVTKNAKPTCMNNTKKPLISVQVKLIDTPKRALSLASALMPACETGTLVVAFG